MDDDDEIEILIIVVDAPLDLTDEVSVGGGGWATCIKCGVTDRPHKMVYGTPSLGISPSTPEFYCDECAQYCHVQELDPNSSPRKSKRTKKGDA